MGQHMTSSQTKQHIPDPKYAQQVRPVDKKLQERLNKLRQQFPWSEMAPPRGHTPSPYSDDKLYYLNEYKVYYGGEWRLGVPHGGGEAILPDGSYFKGYFKNGVAEGPRCLHHTHGQAYYLGPIVANQREGEGVFVDGQYKYEGEWKGNEPNGIGSQTFPNGDCFKGEFNHGVKHGEGEYVWKEGDYRSYQGRFKDDYMEGQGRLQFRDGSTLEGSFTADQNLDIANATLTTKLFTFRGDLPDMRPQEAAGQVRMQNNSGYVFEGRKLEYLDLDADRSQVRRILNGIEESYLKVERHSQALDLISHKLGEYQFKHWSRGIPRSGLLIVQICGRFLQVVKPG